MLPSLLLTAAAAAALAGFPLFGKKKKEEDAAKAEARIVAAKPQVKTVPAAKPLVLKAFVLNRKAELVGELAAEGEVVGVDYDGVLKLLEGKGLTRVKRLESAPYTIHIMEKDDYFMVAFTRSRDDKAVLDEARALFKDTLRDIE